MGPETAPFRGENSRQDGEADEILFVPPSFRKGCAARRLLAGDGASRRIRVEAAVDCNMWDADNVKLYDAWYASPKGAYALSCEQALINSLVSAWPRRNSTLLEIGCGTGVFMELFWEAGFEVYGLDSSPDMLEAARARMGHKAEFFLGRGEHTPFADGEFDFAAFITSLECMRNPEEALAEAFRVAQKGILVVFLNRWSFYWLEASGLPRLARRFPWRKSARVATLQQIEWLSMLTLRRMLWKLNIRAPVTCRSTLYAPSFLWKERKSRKPSPSRWGILPFGGVVAARIDLSPVSVTPMPLRHPKALTATQ